MSSATGRITNLALLFLLALAFASGWMAFELSGQPARAVLVLHGAAGVAIVLLVPWKSLIAKRGLRRPRTLKWASLVLAVGVAISIVFGLLHAAGRPDVGYLTAMTFHVGAAICAIPFLLWHVVARPLRLRATDLGRRSVLKVGCSPARRDSRWPCCRLRVARPRDRSRPPIRSPRRGCSTACRRWTSTRGVLWWVRER